MTNYDNGTNYQEKAKELDTHLMAEFIGDSMFGVTYKPQWNQGTGT